MDALKSLHVLTCSNKPHTHQHTHFQNIIFSVFTTLGALADGDTRLSANRLVAVYSIHGERKKKNLNFQSSVGLLAAALAAHLPYDALTNLAYPSLPAKMCLVEGQIRPVTYEIYFSPPPPSPTPHITRPGNVLTDAIAVQLMSRHEWAGRKLMQHPSLIAYLVLMLQLKLFSAAYSDPHGVSNNALCFANVFLPNLSSPLNFKSL